MSAGETVGKTMKTIKRQKKQHGKQKQNSLTNNKRNKMVENK